MRKKYKIGQEKNGVNWRKTKKGKVESKEKCNVLRRYEREEQNQGRKREKRRKHTAVTEK